MVDCRVSVMFRIRLRLTLALNLGLTLIEGLAVGKGLGRVR